MNLFNKFNNYHNSFTKQYFEVWGGLKRNDVWEYRLKPSSKKQWTRTPTCEHIKYIILITKKCCSKCFLAVALIASRVPRLFARQLSVCLQTLPTTQQAAVKLENMKCKTETEGISEGKAFSLKASIPCFSGFLTLFTVSLMLSECLLKNWHLTF